MLNNEFNFALEDSWLHHSLLTRYAVNDGNQPTVGTYTHTRVLLEEIGNVDTSGGTYDRPPVGYENTSGIIDWTDCTVKVPATSWNIPHMQFASVNGQSNYNPAAGTMTINDGTWAHGNAVMNGYFVLRLYAVTHWWTGDLDTIPIVVSRGSVTLAPHQISSAPTSSDLAAAGVSPDSHYLIILGDW